MIYQVDKHIINKITQNLSFLRFNDTQFYFLAENYYSKDSKDSIPWKDSKTSIIHRLVSSLYKTEFDFEKNHQAFIHFCSDFFNTRKIKTFENIQHVLMFGTKDDIKITELSNWVALEELLKSFDVKDYFYLERLIIRIPCGNLNLNITKLNNIDKILYLEVTSLDSKLTPNSKDLKKLEEELGLTNPIDSNWVDLSI